MRNGLRKNLRRILRPDAHAASPTSPSASHAELPAPPPDAHEEAHAQLQLYAHNAALCHPLVSPALAHLGGLPPLLFIASDREVLRDEIIYTCVTSPLSVCGDVLRGLTGRIVRQTQTRFRSGRM